VKASFHPIICELVIRVTVQALACDLRAAVENNPAQLAAAVSHEAKGSISHSPVHGKQVQV